MGFTNSIEAVAKQVKKRKLICQCIEKNVEVVVVLAGLSLLQIESLSKSLNNCHRRKMGSNYRCRYYHENQLFVPFCHRMQQLFLQHGAIESTKTNIARTKLTNLIFQR